nr:hypothetical protein CPGR_03111 [Mycolicibacterium komanii]
MYGVAPDSLASAATRSTVASGNCSVNRCDRQFVGTAEPFGPGSSSGSGGSASTSRQ